MTNQPPSARPADEDSLTGVIKTALSKAMQSMDVMLPTEATNYDRAANRAVIKHLVQMQGSSGEKVSRADVPSVRVFQLGNAKYSISFPIVASDKGWLLAADRDISIFQQGLREDAPNTARTHSFQDGLFLPDAMANGAPPAGQEDRVVIGANSGNSFIAFDESTIEMRVGAAKVELTATAFTVTIGGNQIVMSAAGFQMTGGSGMTMNGKNIGDTHTHPGVETGPANTGAPNP